MALPTQQKGGIHGTLAPIPIGEKVAHSECDLSHLLGLEIEGLGGERYRLVQLDDSSGVASPARLHFAYTAGNARTFQVADSGAGAAVCGVAVADQDALADNDYFWLQIQGRTELVDSGSGVTAGDLLESAASGKVVTDAAEAAGSSAKQITFAVALADAAANATVYARIIGRLG